MSDPDSDKKDPDPKHFSLRQSFDILSYYCHIPVLSYIIVILILGTVVLKLVACMVCRYLGLVASKSKSNTRFGSSSVRRL